MDVDVCRPTAFPGKAVLFIVSGLPQGISGLACALSRDGFRDANHFGPAGWQSHDTWWIPERAWYAGDQVCFLIPVLETRCLSPQPLILRLKIPELEKEVRILFYWPATLPTPDEVPQLRHKTAWIRRPSLIPAWFPFRAIPLRRIRATDILMSIAALSTVLLPLSHMLNDRSPQSSLPRHAPHDTATEDLSNVDVVIWPSRQRDGALSQQNAETIPAVQAEKLLHHATQALDSGQYDKAVVLCDQAAKYNGEAAIRCGRLFDPSQSPTHSRTSTDPQQALSYYEWAFRHGFRADEEVDALLAWLKNPR